MTNLKIDDKALQLISDFYEIGGGAQIVTELPEVGEEYTIYELKEKKVIQSFVPMFNQQMRTDRVLSDNLNASFVFETTKEVQDTFNSIVPEEESGDIYLNYITSEDKLIGAVYVKGAWKFTEAIKSADCKFDVSEIYVLEDPKYIVILKEYLGMYPEGAETAWYTGRLWNDELYTFEKRVTGILLGTPTIGAMDAGMCAQELEEIPEDFPREFVFETIPYEKIINYQLYESSQWIFTPKSEEVTVTSYWIYTNKEWINIDEIGNYTTNQIFVYTTGDYTNRPDRTITLVEMNMDLEEPVVISEVPYKIIDEEHIIFYNVPYNKTLYLCFDESLVNPSNTDVNSYDFEVSYYDTLGNKNYYSFNIGTIGGSIKVSGSTEG